MAEKRRFSELFYNVWTYLGVIIALVVFILEVFLFVLTFFSGDNVYLGIITYLLLPGVLFAGLALIPFGVWWKRNRIRKGLPQYELRSFRLDLALPTHRNALLVFIVGTAVLVLMSLVGSYQAFHYTESVAFCGTLCHSVMHPEHTTYLKSPHGRVACVECHIGPGAGWFVKSKLSGVRQVFAVMLETYSRPIKTPIHNLRPAKETCNQCHWPGKFFGAIDMRRAYYLTDAGDRPWKLRLLLQVGAGQPQVYGIHAHMNAAHEVFYAAEDERREKMSWIKSVDPDGEQRIFTPPDSPYKDRPPPDGMIRRMDCIDCHNRPSHKFEAPFKLVNEAMYLGQIDARIPEIKKNALEAMTKEYESNAAAQEHIEASLREFYSAKKTGYYQANKATVEAAIVRVKDLFAQNAFPDMKARWDSFPDNIGHMYFPGCARCHDGEHKSPDGRMISRNCDDCHIIVEQGPEGKEKKDIEGMEFRHPDASSDWKDTLCIDCHTGGLDS